MSMCPHGRPDPGMCPHCLGFGIEERRDAVLAKIREPHPTANPAGSPTILGMDWRPHDRVPLREAASEGWWCLKGLLWNLIAPLRRVPLCRLGWHEWCSCCAPAFCVRCEAEQRS